MQPGDILPIPGVSRRGGAMIEAGVLAHRALRNGRRGRVAAVFERSLYVVLDDCWICIGAKDLGSGPLHLLCMGLQPQYFSVGQEVIIADGAILIGDVPFAGLDTASVWAPPPVPDWTLQSLRMGLVAVDEVWRLLPVEQGLAASAGARPPGRPSRLLTAAAPGLAALKRLIEAGLRGQRCAARDHQGIVELIGLGPGLTPSGDDLIGGALVALASLSRLATRDALWRACRAHLDRSNAISAAHLRSAALGYAAAPLHEAVHAVIAGQVDRIRPALTALSKVGHSSGLDALAGALMVLRAVEFRLHRDSAPRDSSLAVSSQQQGSIAGL